MKKTQSGRPFPDDSYRISANTLIEVKEGLDDVVRAISRTRRARGDGAMPLTLVVNSLVMWFLRLSPAEQERIIVDGAAHYARHLGNPTRLPINPSVEGGSRVGIGYTATLGDPPTSRNAKGVHNASNSARRPRKRG